MTDELPFVTSETDLAVYLIQSGFDLLKIQYEPRQNGRQRGIFIFEYSDKIEEYKQLFDSGQASINLNDFKNIKARLLDRIMNGLP